jgi:hypothetical protein
VQLLLADVTAAGLAPVRGVGGVAAGQSVRHRLSAPEMLRMGDVAGKLSFVKMGLHRLAIYGSNPEGICEWLVQ